MKADAQTTSSSKPSVGATAAPVTETPVTETPVTEAPVNETPGAEAPVAPSDTPAPMETGRAGDGQSWAECIEAGAEEGFQRARPAKHPRSQSRRCEPRPPLPFPFQDSEGRLASILQLYDHAAEQPVAHHNVAGRGIMHLHPWKSGHLHDSGVPPDQQCSRSVEPQPNNSTGGSSFAACPKELCTRHRVRRHQGCEGCGLCQDPPGSCLATSAGYSRGRRGDGLRDFGGLVAPAGSPPGVIPDSEDKQPHLSGGCRLRPE